jgi:hypothetical protein
VAVVSAGESHGTALETPEQVAEPVCIRRGLPLVYGAEIVNADREAIIAWCERHGDEMRKASREQPTDTMSVSYDGAASAFYAVAAALRGGVK